MIEVTKSEILDPKFKLSNGFRKNLLLVILSSLIYQPSLTL